MAEQINDRKQLNISEHLDKLSKLTEVDVKTNWYFYPQDLASPPESIDRHWQLAQPNERGYLPWEGGGKVRWFYQKIIIPQHLQGYPLTGLSLRLCLTWWAQLAQIFVAGELVQEGDLFDSSKRILLADSANPEREFTVTLRLVSPEHDMGALMRSYCVYEAKYPLDSENHLVNLDPGLVANELRVLYNYLRAFTPNKIAILAEELAKLDWGKVNEQAEFNQSLARLRNRLEPFSQELKQRCFYLLGHAHLDMAWLWETKETYEVAQRTFASVLNLQRRYPPLTFGHTSACLYQWVEDHNPQLFAQIQQAVKSGQWESLGGMWVEPEVNLISGESLVRQLLYGQKYFQAKFGQIDRVAWLPDSFGFPWQLPQILLQAGIKYFVTGKLHWNDTNKFPYGCFWWQSPDGSKILSLLSPPNVTGVMDTNPMTMTDYGIDWELQTGLKDIFWLPGVGDHGGGPTLDMLQVARRYSHSPLFPQVKFSRAGDYLAKIERESPRPFPTWNDELYLELHRGCYTTHGEQKYFNRRAQNLLYQAELFSTLAALVGGKGSRKQSDYPIIIKDNLNSATCQPDPANIQSKIEAIWKQVLFNQFHDILPGTSITEVFLAANQTWQDAISQGEEILRQSLAAIAACISLPEPPTTKARPLVVFNPLNWSRSEVVEMDWEGTRWDVCDHRGQQLITQVSAEGKLLFWAENIPSIGYQVFWLLPRQELPKNSSPQGGSFRLENQYLRVKIDGETGNLRSVYDKSNQKEALEGQGNQLQLFQDRGQYWDAWNIDPNYQDLPLPSPSLKSIEWLEQGPLRSTIRVHKKFNQSEFIQDYVLEDNSPILKIKNTVNWHEDRVLLKVAFPLGITSDFGSCEIACGAIKRKTRPEIPQERAKWEVYAHNWVDLGTETYGVSLLNDCKYGCDLNPSQIRLSLLRSPQWPDPKCDRGCHHFTYALYPHAGTWQQANTVHRGYELNLPLQPLILEQRPNGDGNHEGILSPRGKLLDLGASNLILMALKLAEGGEGQVILRCYECCGQVAQLDLDGDLNLELKSKVNLLEEKETDINVDPRGQLKVGPWQIRSFSSI